jgi:hypothetical protein
MLWWVDRIGRSCVAVPLLLVGLALTTVAGWLIEIGAWLADVEDE